MHQLTESALVQIITSHLFSAKRLPEPMLTYCQLDPWEQASVKLNMNFIIFFQEKAFQNVVCQNGG